MILKIKYIIIIFLIISCQQTNKGNNMKIYENTNEFKELQKSSKISFLEAKAIFQKYHNENSYKKLETVFYYYEDGFYYFGYHTDPLKDKQNKIWYFIEAKINVKTGGVFELEEAIDYPSKP